MNGSDDILEKWYVGELGGAALFKRLQAMSVRETACKWALLAQVELAMGAALAVVLASRSVKILVPHTLEARARERAESVAGKTWLEKMQWLRDIAARALARMTAEAQTLPEGLRATAELMLGHEQVLLDFAELEIAGKPSEAQVCVKAFLQNVTDFDFSLLRSN